MNGVVVATSRRNGNGKSIASMAKAAPDSMQADHELVLSALLDLLPGTIYFKDSQSRFIFVNAAKAEQLKLTPEDAVGKSDFDFFTEEHARPAFEDEQEIMRTGRSVLNKEERETWPDGRVTWCSTTKMPLRDKDGRTIGTYGWSRDVTEKQADA